MDLSRSSLDIILKECNTAKKYVDALPLQQKKAGEKSSLC